MVNPLGDLLTRQVISEQEVDADQDSRPRGEKASMGKTMLGERTKTINIPSHSNPPEKDLLKKLFGAEQNNASMNMSIS